MDTVMVDGSTTNSRRIVVAREGAVAGIEIPGVASSCMCPLTVAPGGG